MQTFRLTLTLLLSAAIAAVAQTSAPKPPPKPVPQPDPQTLALAETVEVKTPATAPIDWKGWPQKLPGVQTQSDFVYGTGGGRPLHAELAWPETPSAKPMPAIIWIHGGAWVGQSQKPNFAIYFATRGYFTASIEYRLGGEAKWPAQIQDCKLAVRWLRANAAKYNVDPDHIGVWGQSAGGHLVSCVGTLDDPALEGDGGYPGVSSQVQAVCDWFGPVDFRTEGPFQLFGVHQRDNPALYLSASPYVHIKATQPPFLVVHGDRDITVHNAMHGFVTAPGATGISPDRSEILGRMADFFDKYLKK
jgi:acetyl esterase/lipase